MQFLVLRLCVFVLVMGFSAGVSGAEPALKFKLATMAPADSPWDDALRSYKKSLAQRTAGSLALQLYLGGRLGSETETVNQVKFGSTECAAVSTGAFAGAVPGLDVFELPFLWDSPEQAAEAIRKLTPYFDREFAKLGFQLVGWSENGWRNFMTSGAPIKTLADLEGLKVRSQENALHMAFWKELGAKPVPLSTTDFEQAMKSGQIQGGDNSVVLTAAFGWQNTIKSFTVSRHSYQPAVVVCNKHWFAKLPVEHQRVIAEEMHEVEKSTLRKLNESEKQFLEFFSARGITLFTLDQHERAAFAARTAPVRAKFSAGIPKEVMAVVNQVKAGK